MVVVLQLNPDAFPGGRCTMVAAGLTVGPVSTAAQSHGYFRSGMVVRQMFAPSSSSRPGRGTERRRSCPWLAAAAGGGRAAALHVGKPPDLLRCSDGPYPWTRFRARHAGDRSRRASLFVVVGLPRDAFLRTVPGCVGFQARAWFAARGRIGRDARHCAGRARGWPVLEHRGDRCSARVEDKPDVSLARFHDSRQLTPGRGFSSTGAACRGGVCEFRAVLDAGAVHASGHGSHPTRREAVWRRGGGPEACPRNTSRFGRQIYHSGARPGSGARAVAA